MLIQQPAFTLLKMKVHGEASVLVLAQLERTYCYVAYLLDVSCGLHAWIDRAGKAAKWTQVARSHGTSPCYGSDKISFAETDQSRLLPWFVSTSAER